MYDPDEMLVMAPSAATSRRSITARSARTIEIGEFPCTSWLPGEGSIHGKVPLNPKKGAGLQFSFATFDLRTKAISYNPKHFNRGEVDRGWSIGTEGIFIRAGSTFSVLDAAGTLREVTNELEFVRWQSSGGPLCFTRGKIVYVLQQVTPNAVARAFPIGRLPTGSSGRIEVSAHGLFTDGYKDEIFFMPFNFSGRLSGGKSPGEHRAKPTTFRELGSYERDSWKAGRFGLVLKRGDSFFHVDSGGQEHPLGTSECVLWHVGWNGVYVEWKPQHFRLLTFA